MKNIHKYLMVLSFLVACNAWAWPWSSNKKAVSVATPASKSEPSNQNSIDVVEQKRRDRIEPGFKFTKNSENKLKELFSKYSDKYNAENKKYGKSSNWTFILHDVSQASYNFTIYVDDEKFQKKYFKILGLWDKHQRACSSKNDDPIGTIYGQNLARLKYAYTKLFNSVKTNDEMISRYGFETICDHYGQTCLKEVSEYWENFKNTDSQLDDWLSKQK